MENDDVIEEVNETSTSEGVVENQEQVKTYTEDEVETIREQMKADNQKAWDKRWGREKGKMEKQYEKESQIINLLKRNMETNDIDDLTDKLFDFYQEPKPTRVSNSKDDEVLGKYDAKEILELDDETIEEEANRLAGLNRTAREEAEFLELGEYLTKKKETEKRKKEIKESGIDEGLLDDEDFKSFMSKFNKDVGLKDIYDIYSKSHTSTKKEKPFSAGSLKGNTTKEESEFFTEEEFMALTEKDLENPKIYEKAMKSRLQF